jgi:MOSC domain-containing protein YiiM
VPEPGTFGENLTLSSFGPEAVRIGDRYRVGEALLEVTAPRIPLRDLRDANGPAELGAAVAAARKPGLYVRVLEPGEVAVGDSVDRLGAMTVVRSWST